MDDAVQFAELLAYTTEETTRWRQFFEKNPAALDVACDIAGTGSIRKLLAHVFFAELHFARLIQGEPRADFDKLPANSVEELFAIHSEAVRRFQEFLKTGAAGRWNEVLPLGFRDLRASRRKMFVQAMLHGVAHRAQLATVLRQNGLKQDWIHDFILSGAMS